MTTPKTVHPGQGQVSPTRCLAGKVTQAEAPLTALLAGDGPAPLTKPSAITTGQRFQAAGLSSQGKEGRKECVVLLYSHRVGGIHCFSGFAFIWFPNSASRWLMFPPSTNYLKEKQLCLRVPQGTVCPSGLNGNWGQPNPVRGQWLREERGREAPGRMNL